MEYYEDAQPLTTADDGGSDFIPTLELTYEEELPVVPTRSTQFQPQAVAEIAYSS